jgi:hypothetical protein
LGRDWPVKPTNRTESSGACSELEFAGRKEVQET